MRLSDARADLTAFNRIALDVLAPLLVYSALASRDFRMADHTALLIGGTVLILGSGLLAWPLAKAFGAVVVVTAGSEEKCQACRDLGADLAINYRTQDFVAVLGEKGGTLGGACVVGCGLSRQGWVHVITGSCRPFSPSHARCTRLSSPCGRRQWCRA